MTFNEFVCDFIRDDSDTWWFIGLKAFIVDVVPPIVNIKAITMYGEPEAKIEDTNFDNKKVKSYYK